MVTTKPRKTILSKPLLIWGTVGLLAATVGLGWFVFPQKPQAPVIQTVTVTQGPMLKTVAATGKVVPNFEVEIKAKASGKIIRLPYDVSDIVPKGALLVELDPIDENRNVSQAVDSLSGYESKVQQAHVNLTVAQRTLETDLARARADLAAAQAKAGDARAKAQRLKALLQQKYISQEEAETGRTNEAQANSDLKNARTRLHELETQQIALNSQMQDLNYAKAQSEAQQVALAQAQQRLSETKLYAPIAGVITTRVGQIGNIVASGVTNVGGGTAIMTMADLTHIFVLASVDESDIGQVQEGQTVNITADAYPGQKFQGKVVRIAPEGVDEANVVTFEVKIEVLGKNSKLLKPTMTTNVEIVVAQKTNTLKVPEDAVQTSRRGNRFVLMKLPDGQLKRQKVDVGLDNGTEIEILDGLQAGEQIASGQGQARSRWRKDQSQQGNGSGSNRRGQMMMMRGLGGGGRR